MCIVGAGRRCVQGGFNEDSHFYSGFSCNKPLVSGSCCRDW